MARDLVGELDRRHRRFAERHNDWCDEIERISPASPDYHARLVDGFQRRGLVEAWREVEEVIRRMATEGEV